MRARSPGVRRRQRIGLAAGVGLAVLALLALALPGQERLHAHGPLNAGHARVACADCHIPAPGTLRQQLQANVRYLLGMRETSADFGRRDVGNDACLACHARPDDRHPVFRFLEPRFAEARRAIAPQECLSCHREHTGRRVTRDDGFCVHCHGGLTLRADPIDVPHAELVASARWSTCLGCHDFHGNHVMAEATSLASARPPEATAAYFAGGPSPYPAERRHRARERRDGPAPESSDAR